jgi:hypothetical protein
MRDMDRRLHEILARKPDLVVDFPDWMLPASEMNEVIKTGNVALAEMAGRDSFAAVIRACETNPIQVIVPTVAYTGTEYGDWEITFEKIEILRERLQSSNIRLVEAVVLGSPRLWWKLCGRYTTHFFKKFGYYSHCLGCHLYFHALRIPLAKKLRSNLIIGGERESHDGRIKINQTGMVLDIYRSFMKKYDIELLLPIRHIQSGKEIESMLGMNWDEGGQQLECVLSKNYQEANGGVNMVEEAVRSYFDEFALKTAGAIVDGYLRRLN